MTDNLVFEAYPKTPRLNRNMVVTEKIDGTNAGILIQPAAIDVDDLANGNLKPPHSAFAVARSGYDFFWVGAQSRNRLITPSSDNVGFAGWVERNAEALVRALGPGRHFGEWWGSGIQRGYGLTEKRFSLFNVDRWQDNAWLETHPVPGLGVVPVLARHTFSTAIVKAMVDDLRENGSHAVPGFRAEGVVVYHTAANQVFKMLVEDDEQPKSMVQRVLQPSEFKVAA